jgi:hypothetical protein
MRICLAQFIAPWWKLALCTEPGPLEGRDEEKENVFTRYSCDKVPF